MSQERMGDQNSRVVNNHLGAIPGAPDISNVLARTSRALDKVRIVHGANEKYFDHLSGKTVGSVRKALRDAFNIPGDASAMIDGKEVSDEFILQSGHNLEFSKQAGVKGLFGD